MLAPSISPLFPYRRSSDLAPSRAPARPATPSPGPPSAAAPAARSSAPGPAAAPPPPAPPSAAHSPPSPPRSEEHTSELQSLRHLVCRLLLEKKTTIPPSPP